MYVRVKLTTKAVSRENRVIRNANKRGIIWSICFRLDMMTEKAGKE